MMCSVKLFVVIDYVITKQSSNKLELIRSIHLSTKSFWPDCKPEEPLFLAQFVCLSGPLLCAEFHLHQCNMSPLRGEKTQNQPLSNLNTGALRCAQCCW